MSNSHPIGLIIRSCRESRGFSQDYMADMLDIAQSAYACLESGKTTMSIDRLIRITEILDLDIHEVLEKSMPALHHSDQSVYLHHPLHPLLYPDTKEAYDILILELKGEIEFLRGLIKKDYSGESGILNRA